MKKPIITTALFLLSSFFFHLSAQTIERNVISSFGNSYIGASVQIDYTIGEMITFTGQNSNVIATQGFQQPEFTLNVCLGDFDFNGVVNVSDLLVFMGSFGTNSSGVTDLDGNGIVHVNDLLIFMGVFGQTCF